MKVWNIADGKETQNISTASKVGSLAFSSDGELVCIATDEGPVLEMELGNGKLGREIIRLNHDGPTRVVAIDPKGDVIAVAFGTMAGWRCTATEIG